MTKTNQYYYDKLRDCYNLVCENEQQRNKPAAPIKKKKPTFEKSKYIKYGSGYADQGTGGSRIRTTTKDWDEGYVADEYEQPKRKTFKEFIEFIEESDYKNKKISKKDIELEEYMEQCYLAAKSINDFKLWMDFVNSIS